ncbi:MAG: hypothetical protein ONB14_12385 [candidate division KSB1 bacterium]|nr:hypothetical protein [candidate division KSB1 bacterium]
MRWIRKAANRLLWNSPGAGWQQLWDQVKDDQGRLEHSTDVTWGN